MQIKVCLFLLLLACLLLLLFCRFLVLYPMLFIHIAITIVAVFYLFNYHLFLSITDIVVEILDPINCIVMELHRIFYKHIDLVLAFDSFCNLVLAK